MERNPASSAQFAPLPGAASQAKNYAAWQKDFVAAIYGTRKLTLLKSTTYSQVSAIDEKEGDFRVRLQQASREQRDAAVAKLRAKYAPKMANLNERLRRAEQAVEREAAQARQAKFSSVLSMISNCIIEQNVDYELIMSVEFVENIGGISNNNNSSAVISNCIIRDTFEGPGIVNVNSSPSIMNCYFQNNGGHARAGGIYNHNSNPEIFACTFFKNGAYYAGAILNENSSPKITYCNFLYNNSQFGGAGIDNDNSNPIINNCFFFGGYTQSGAGGIYNAASSPVIKNCIFLGKG